MTDTTDANSADLAFRVRDLLADIFATEGLVTGPHGLIQLRGYLRVPSDEAFRKAADRLELWGLVARFRRAKGYDVILIVPKVPVRPSRLWVNWLLLGLTVLSVLFVGLPSLSLQGLAQAVPFAATLLGILLAHELGHYCVGRHYGMELTLPYFIPMPFSYFGTMGALIQLKSSPPNRRALLAMAAAGPLCGFAVALPLLFVGLALSPITPLPATGALLEGNSLLYAAAKYLVFGRLLPSGGMDVNLHPVAFAAWAGVFLTGLNLIPAGQLDGGHIAYVLLGEQRARQLTFVLAIALSLLAIFVWPGWMLPAALLFILGRSHAAPLDEITPLHPRQAALAVAMMLLFVLTFTPIPMIEL